MKKSTLRKQLQKRRVKKYIKNCIAFTTAFLATLSVFTMTAFADVVTDPLNKTNDLLFGILRTVGIGITGYNFFELSAAIKSHDGAQKAQAFLGIASGLIIVFIKEILGIIGVSV
ncbi:MAG: hypothetical protein K2H13_08935 [Eubacterium sp.]|nr:hypothetical protein [Eubacterium sp.]